MWQEHFSSHYKQISITELNQESNCTLCGHPIYKNVGVIKRTGGKEVVVDGQTFSIPDIMTVGCDCYGLKNGSSIINIIDKLQKDFPGLEVKLYEGKIMVLDLISQLSKIKHSSYKLMIPMRYLYVSDCNKLYDCLNRSQYNNIVITQKMINGWGDVVFSPYNTPLSKVHTDRVSLWMLEQLGNSRIYPGTILIINSDMFNK